VAAVRADGGVTVADDLRPRPTPRPRPADPARPSPRPRVAGSRRERDEPAPVPGIVEERPRRARARRERPAAPVDVAEAPRRRLALPVALLVLVLAAAVAAGLLLWQRLNPSHVDGSIFAATQEDIEALYAYDYRDSGGSVRGKLDVLTGELRQQYEADLADGGIIDTYEQVSATTRYDVVDIGLQQVNAAQDSATMVVFGSYVVESVNSGDQPAPEGSECRVTDEGAQACTQTVKVHVVEVDGDWKISELTLLTSS
jgi:hypothetical protein